MKIDIFYKNITSDSPLEVFIRQKIGGLEKYTGNGDSVEARVELGLPSKHHRSGDIFYAEANLKIEGKLLRASYQDKDLRAAVVEVKNELQKQIKKFKDKKKDISRRIKA